MSEPDYVRAHKHCFCNRDDIMASDLCGCFFCLAVFPPAAVEQWVAEKDGGQTAMCPQCAIDSVIGSQSNFPITEEFLAKMEAHWFGLRSPRENRANTKDSL
jgi:hypothetical protein